MILDAYQEDMRRTGASDAEMFKKVKQELAKKYKAVLCRLSRLQTQQAGTRGGRHTGGDRGMRVSG